MNSFNVELYLGMKYYLDVSFFSYCHLFTNIGIVTCMAYISLFSFLKSLFARVFMLIVEGFVLQSNFTLDLNWIVILNFKLDFGGMRRSIL